MTHADCRIGSLQFSVDPLLSDSRLSTFLVSNGGVAVVMPAKCVTIPVDEEFRVVHIFNGDCIFRKSTAPSASLGEDW